MMQIEKNTFRALVTILSDIAKGKVAGTGASNHAQAALDTLSQKHMVSVEKDENGEVFYFPLP